MKIYKYIHNILSGACLLLTTIAATSCDNANDWTVDAAHNRLFSCDLSGVTPEDIGTEATLEFKTVKGAEYYLIEVSKDTLYNDIEMGSTATSIIYGEDKSIKESPYTMTGLDSSTKYYLRLKAMSGNTPESKWSYLSDYSFKTKSEQIFEEISTADLTENSVVLHWLANAEVTKLEILKGEEVKVTKDLTNDNEAVTNGTITIDGLEAQTNYTAKIYKDNIVRGTIGFTTFAAVPSADLVYRMTADENLSNELLAEITAQCEPNSSITIAIPAGSVLKSSKKLTLPDGYSYTFFGAAGEKKPVITIQQLEFTSHSFIKFQNVELNANGIDETGINKQYDYFINAANDVHVDNITFVDCDILGYKLAVIRLKDTNTAEIKNITFNNCYIKGGNITNSGYSILDTRNEGKFGNILFENTTINGNGYAGIIYSKNCDVDKITIESCTVYNSIVSSSKYFIDFDKKGNKATNGIIINNTIMGKAEGRGIRSGNDVICDNVWFTNDFQLSEYKFTPTGTFEGSSTDLFEAPENDNFKIKSYNFGGRLNAGAIKWRMTE